MNRYEECRSQKQTKKAFEQNPRGQGQFSFEVIKYALNEAFMNRIKNQSMGRTCLEDQLLILHLASDFKTGLLREIGTLVANGMIDIDEHGSTVLKDGWESKIHPYVLVDMFETGWGLESDSENKFLIHEVIRIALHSEWKHTQEGWFSKSHKKILHYHIKYDHSRQVFDSNFEDYMNEVHGIAQFGV